jgi:ribonuclease BN (tRNA processing enzyme)
MDILALGVGEAFAKTLYQTNYRISPAEGEPFLLDFGHTAPRALHALGIDLRAAPRVLISHLHGDHIGGLEELGFSGYFHWGERPRLYLPEDLLGELWDHALSAAMTQRLTGSAGEGFQATLNTYFDVTALAGGRPFLLGSAEITPFPTPHVAGRPSWGFRIHDRATGKTALFTCDSCFEPANLEALGADANLIFHDCQFAANGAHIHATLEELLTLPTMWQERILLVHYGDDWRRYAGKTGQMDFACQGQSYRL